MEKRSGWGPASHSETRNSQQRPKAGLLLQSQTPKVNWSSAISRTILPRHHRPERNPRSHRSATERRGRAEVMGAVPTPRSSAKATLPQHRQPRRSPTRRRSATGSIDWRWRTKETVGPSQSPSSGHGWTRRLRKKRTLRLKAEEPQSSSSIPAGSSEYSSIMGSGSNDELLMADDHVKSSVRKPQSCSRARRLSSRRSAGVKQRRKRTSRRSLK